MSPYLPSFGLLLRRMGRHDLNIEATSDKVDSHLLPTSSVRSFGNFRWTYDDRAFDRMLRLIFRFTLITVAIAHVEIDSNYMQKGINHLPNCCFLTRPASRLDCRILRRLQLQSRDLQKTRISLRGGSQVEEVVEEQTRVAENGKFARNWQDHIGIIEGKHKLSLERDQCDFEDVSRENGVGKEENEEHTMQSDFGLGPNNQRNSGSDKALPQMNDSEDMPAGNIVSESADDSLGHRDENLPNSENSGNSEWSGDHQDRDIFSKSRNLWHGTDMTNDEDFDFELKNGTEPDCEYERPLHWPDSRIEDFMDSDEEAIGSCPANSATINMEQKAQFYVGASASAYKMMGRREYMEDDFSILVDKGAGAEGEIPALFGVFDGHGGSRASEYCKENLLARVSQLIVGRNDINSSSAVENVNATGTEEENSWKAEESKDGPLPEEQQSQKPRVISRLWMKRALDFGFSSIDQELHHEVCICGTTAIVAAVTSRYLMVANVGDSRGVLCQDGRAVPMSDDHKPNRPDERRRIELAGGMVVTVGVARVGGILAVSRAIGDSPLKQFVPATPEYKVIRRYLLSITRL
uniref:PPM-type phosphatase domain-containing protein n=1 Tax=Guillardia theta TaxID=55529 RepID=A0A6U6BKW0_GUITH|mmetsp:Transcript_36579/g.114209  ORF Transcript_36579/g.114209 Transcript_36579/m.114209 type:complete len:579 (+) Transcript_36579:161-1897(+)